MKITNIRDIPVSERIYTFEDTLRDSFAVCLKSVRLSGRNNHYPNCLLETEGHYINPYDERVMSLQKDSFYENDEFLPSTTSLITYDYITTRPIFFFMYNMDNYYHFVYDTLPILAHYFILKKTIPDLQILIATSHPTKLILPLFVEEFFEKLDITYYMKAPMLAYYETVYVGTSLTHGTKSNSPPSEAAISIWNRLISLTTIPPQISMYPMTSQSPKRFYVSRRSWIHGKTENMGTNYTTRRKCMNEDEVVALLAKYDVQEIFTELLSTEQKLEYFKNAELVIGIIGGGVCNLLFSPSNTKALIINTPYFLDINKRFRHSMDHTQICYSESAFHTVTPSQKYKLFSRIKVINTESPAYGCVGEVEEYENGVYMVNISSNDVAGFSQDFKFKKAAFQEEELEAVDQGLNSPFIVDIKWLELDLKFHLEI